MTTTSDPSSRLTSLLDIACTRIAVVSVEPVCVVDKQALLAVPRFLMRTLKGKHGMAIALSRHGIRMKGDERGRSQGGRQAYL